MAYTIELSDGSILNNLALNGNNFVRNSPIDKDIFNHNLSPVIITSDEQDDMALVSTGVHDNMYLVKFEHEDGSNEWSFILNDISESEMQYLKTQSDVEYIALMMDIEL